MSESRFVKIVNMSSGRVCLIVPDTHFKVIFEKKNSQRVIEFDILQRALYNSGVEALFTSGVLYIENMNDKIDLGLEAPGTTEPVRIISLSDAEKKRYLTVMPFADFKLRVAELHPEQVAAIVDYAIANEVVDMNKAALLEQMTGTKIVKAIQLKREAAEPEPLSEQEKAFNQINMK